MVFNSLGSNYDVGFVFKSLFAVNNPAQSGKLQKYLNKKYGGASILLYKNREGIKMALELSGLPKGSKVAINGFTCFVVYKAVVDAGMVPVYLDINPKTLNFDLGSLKKAGSLSAVIIQNTLGNPLDASGIIDYCRKNKILVIEDLAHSAGAVYGDGKEAGTFGDFTVLSFSQDKIIDGVSGGALIVRNKDIKFDTADLDIKRVGLGQSLKDRFYPALTYLIRKTYPAGVGRYLHFLSKKIKIISKPIGNSLKTTCRKLPDWEASLINYRFSRFGPELNHRRKIAEIYAGNIKEEAVSGEINKNIWRSACIRYPVFVDKRSALVKFLKKNGIFVSDIWYDAPVAPPRMLPKTDYKTGTCRNSERVSRKILNLPTHINVSPEEAVKISGLINKWLNTNLQ